MSSVLPATSCELLKSSEKKKRYLGQAGFSKSRISTEQFTQRAWVMDDSQGNEARPALFRVGIQYLLALLKNLLTLRYHKAAPRLDCTSPGNHSFVCLLRTQRWQERRPWKTQAHIAWRDSNSALPHWIWGTWQQKSKAQHRRGQTLPMWISIEICKTELIFKTPKVETCTQPPSCRRPSATWSVSAALLAHLRKKEKNIKKRCIITIWAAFRRWTTEHPTPAGPHTAPHGLAWADAVTTTNMSLGGGGRRDIQKIVAVPSHLTLLIYTLTIKAGASLGSHPPQTHTLKLRSSSVLLRMRAFCKDSQKALRKALSYTNGISSVHSLT